VKVVDTSVVLKWYVSEEGSESAAQIIGTQLIAPDLILAELSNALWKKHRRGEIGPEQARLALAEVELSVALIPAASLVHRAFAIAMELKHPVYDCYFLALAEQSGCPLLTADRRLLSRCADTPFAACMVELGGGAV
jgi:predicted nucleic acid-binding protein